MRHQLRVGGWALLLSAFLPVAAKAVAWTPDNTVKPSGNVVSWTSTSAGEDSGILVCQGTCLCDNTHTTSSFTVYRATKAGTKLTGDYWKGVAATNCSDVTLDQCITVELTAGTYIFDPDAAAVNTAECRGRREDP